MQNSKKKKLRIFSCAWHLSHQYDLTSLPNTEWYYLHNWVRKAWSDPLVVEQRPKRDNVHFVTHFDPKKYDLAIIHYDQQCIDESYGKSKLFRWMCRLTRNIPRIIINHGTPNWAEQYDKLDIIDKSKKLLGDIPMVVNSKEAAKDWGWGNTIIHAMNPDEWFADIPKQARVCTYIPPAGWENYYNRMLMIKVREEMNKRGLLHLWFQVDSKPVGDEYKRLVGSSLIYFNPTRHAPMPRSRTEAMLSNCCIVTTKTHDVDTFIEHGVNGYLVNNNPWEVVDLLDRLINKEFKKTIEIGKKGRETALKLFNYERYYRQWNELIAKTLKEWKEKHG